jgi:hypothetical protein
VAWDVRNGTRYYYRSVREGRRVRRVYLGTGPGGERAAAEDAARRARRQAQPEARRDEQARRDEADALITDLVRLTDALARAALMAAGYFRHARGAWRRRRAPAQSARTQPMTSTASTPTAADPQAATGPKAGGPPPADREAIEHLSQLVRRAEQGDPSALGPLRQALDADPAAWRGYRDLAALAEATWLRLLAGTNLMLFEAAWGPPVCRPSAPTPRPRCAPARRPSRRPPSSARTRRTGGCCRR